MSTQRHHSEERLAELVCGPLRSVAGARVLIGGLGLGFTLRAALRSLADDARVEVVELIDAVIRWNQHPDYGFAGALRDPRVTIRHDDVARVLASNAGGFDGIMLDVDNGAEAFTTTGNAELYRSKGIASAAAALKHDGRLAYWSADPDCAFADALHNAGLSVVVDRARAYGAGSVRHVLYVAQRPH
jgi:spermidine synthase